MITKRAAIFILASILLSILFVSAEEINNNQMNCSWLEKEKTRCALSGGTSREMKSEYGGYGGPTCPWIVCDYNKPSAFSTRESCESSSSNFCSYRECNYVPYGKTYEETCGKNFVKGWYADGPKSAEGMACQYGGDCPSSLTCQNNKCVRYNYNYPCADWGVEQINNERARCEKIGGQYSKVENYMGGCANYRCFSNEKCGSSGEGYLECSDGYYCEQQQMNQQYSGNYSNLGKCIKIPFLKITTPTPNPTPTTTPSPTPNPTPTLTPTPIPTPEQNEDLSQIEDINKLLVVALKLEEVRMQFDGLKKNVLDLKKYYEGRKNKVYSEKFKKASELLDKSIKTLDEVKTTLKSKVEKEDFTSDTLNSVKNSLSELKNNTKEVVKELLK